MNTITFTAVCQLTDLPVESGAVVLVAGQAIALFRLADDQVFAINNFDPMVAAPVLGRGLLGNKGEQLVVASPMLKHCYDLTTGVCLDDPAVSVPVYPVNVVGGAVLVAAL